MSSSLCKSLPFPNPSRLEDLQACDDRPTAFCPSLRCHATPQRWTYPQQAGSSCGFESHNKPRRRFQGGTPPGTVIQQSRNNEGYISNIHLMAWPRKAIACGADTENANTTQNLLEEIRVTWETNRIDETTSVIILCNSYPDTLLSHGQLLCSQKCLIANSRWSESVEWQTPVQNSKGTQVLRGEPTVRTTKPRTGQTMDFRSILSFI